jgi:hypothetical protein
MFKRTFQRDAVFVMALYNIAIGAVFFFLYKEIFKLFGLESYRPVHAPTIQIPCFFLVVFGIGYLAAFHDMVRNRALLFVGLLQNGGMAALAIWYKIQQAALVHNVYLLPAVISIVFAVLFLIAWFGSVVEAGRQRRRGKLFEVKPAPRRPVEPEAALPEEPEAPPLEPAGEMPEPPSPDAPAQPEPPNEEPPLRFLAQRDRSGIHPDEPPPPPQELT